MRWRNTTYSVYTGDYAYPEESFAADASRCTEVVDVIAPNLATRLRAYTDFLGFARVLTVEDFGTAVYISRQTPKPYGAFVGEPVPPNASECFLWCKSIPRSKPYSVATAVAPQSTVAPNWRMNLDYITTPWRCAEDGTQIPRGDLAYLSPLVGFPDEGWTLFYSANTNIFGASNPSSYPNARYITKEVRAGARNHLTGPGNLSYITSSPSGNPGGAMPVGFPIREPFLDVRYGWHEVPIAGIPWQAIQSCLGCINMNASDSVPPECMLMTSAEIKFYNSPFGARIADCHYSFRVQFNMSYRPDRVGGPLEPRGHRWILRTFTDMATAAQRLDYVRVGTTTNFFTATPPYTTRDFAALFRPDQPT